MPHHNTPHGSLGRYTLSERAQEKQSRMSSVLKTQLRKRMKMTASCRDSVHISRRTLFRRAVCDAAHRMKSTKPRTTQALLKLEADCYDTLSVTFMITKINDLGGALYIHANTGIRH